LLWAGRSGVRIPVQGRGFSSKRPDWFGARGVPRFFAGDKAVEA